MSRASGKFTLNSRMLSVATAKAPAATGLIPTRSAGRDAAIVPTMPPMSSARTKSSELPSAYPAVRMMLGSQVFSP
jgi:hypothetical protein